jgi:hypothetical protein
LSKQDEHKPAETKPTSHRVLWALVAVFIVAAITAMMLADYYYAPGSSGTSSEPKDAADK